VPPVSLDVPWEPRRRVAGDPAALAAALRAASPGEFVLRVSPRVEQSVWQELFEPVADRIRAVEWHVARSPWAGDAPPSRELDGARPRYAAPSGAWPRDDGPRSVVVLEPAALEGDAARGWAALPAVTVGGCDEVLARLAEAQEFALVDLEAQLDRAEALAGRAFRGALTSGAEPGAVAKTPGPPVEAGCAASGAAVVDARAACAAGRCDLEPRVVVDDAGARIVVPWDGRDAPPCSARAADAQRELRRATQAGAAALTDALDRAALHSLVRIVAIARTHGALVETCAPRRLRWSEEDVAGARRELVRVGDLLSVAPGNGAPAWLPAAEHAHVPGLGRVEVLRRLSPAADDPATAAARSAERLRDDLLARARCAATQDADLLRVAVVRAGELVHFGYVYPEELGCEGLGPDHARIPGGRRGSTQGDTRPHSHTATRP
jgi:hypothetical protein